MEILKLLLAKAIVLLCLCLFVQERHTWNSWMLLQACLMMYNAIYVNVLSSSICDGKIQFVSKMFSLTTLFLILLLPLLVDLLNETDISDFMSCYVLSFNQYRHCMILIYLEIVSFLIIILKLLNIYLRWLRTLTLNAIFIVFITCNMSSYVLFSIYTDVMETFFDTLQGSAMFESKAHIGIESINTTLYMQPVIKTKIFTKCYGKFLFNEEYIQNDTYVMEYLVMQKYIGEDLTMNCKYNMSGLLNISTYWMLNEAFIYDTWRIQSLNQVSYTQRNETNVFSVLRVRFLQKADFGQYKCLQHLRVETESGAFESNRVMFVYNLTEISEQFSVLRVDVGNLLFSPNFFFYHTDEYLDDMFAEYTVNGENINKLCSGNSFELCSLAAFILLQCNRENQFVKLQIFGYTWIEIKHVVIKYCLCSKAYGVHRVTFIRKFLGKNRGVRMIDIQHPHTFILLPRTGISFFRQFDDSSLYSDIEDLLTNKSDLSVIESKFLEKVPLIESNEAKNLFIAHMFEFLYLFSITILVYWLTVRLSKWYCQRFIRFPALKYDQRPQIENTNDLSSREQYDYDVFVSYSEVDYNFVTGKIVPVLEKNFRVCFQGRDFVPGKLNYSQYQTSFVKSRKWIVLLSAGYKNDEECNELQLNRFILPSLNDKRRALFIMYDEGACLPEELRNDTAAQVLDWRTYVSERRKLVSVNQWVKTGRLSD